MSANCLFILLSLFLINIGVGLPTISDHLTVITKYGRIQGTRKSVDSYSFEEFLGIKYGLIPKRFAYSVVNNETWQDVFKAEAYGLKCTQLPFEGTSEDCLFINIWRPVNQTEASLLPVLLWVHGSGYMRGSGENDPGDLIAASGPVIVASINYRLASFGYAYGDPDEMPGNQGVGDVVTALKWVRENIGYFGGDPTRVTLGGHSAGSMIGSMFPVMETVDQSLYSQLFILSGVSVNQMFIEDTTVALAKTKLLASKVECGPVTEGPLAREVIECLQKVDALTLVSRNQDEDIKVLGGASATAFIPIYGTELVPKPLIDLFWSAKNATQRLRIINGISKDETATFWGYLKPRTRSEAFKMLFDQLSYIKKDLTEAEMQPFYDYYFNGVDDSDAKALRTALAYFMDDYSWRCTSIILSEVYSYRHSVHFTEFDYILDKYGLSARPDGPWHGDAVELYFGNPLRSESLRHPSRGSGSYSAKDAETSKRLMDSLIKFISGEVPKDWPEIHFDKSMPYTKPTIRLIDYKDSEVEYNEQSICIQWSKLLDFYPIY